MVEASVAQQYEGRLTKLQSIITDLSFKLDNKKSKMGIVQGDEDEHTISGKCWMCILIC